MKITMQKLNKHFFPFVVVLVLFLGICSPVKANAVSYDILDYTDLDYSVKYGDSVNTVVYQIPSDWFLFWWTSSKYGTSEQVKGSTLTLSTGDINYGFNIGVYPSGLGGLSVDNMPVGAKLYVDITIDESGVIGATGYHNVLKRGRYLDKVATWVKTLPEVEPTIVSLSGDVYTYSLDYIIESVDSAVSFVPSLYYENYTQNADGKLVLKITSARVEMEVSTEFWSQFQAQQNGKLLNDLVNGTEEQNQSAQDFSESMDSAIGDLESAGDSLNQVDTPSVDVDELIPNDVLLGEAYLNYVTAIQPFWDCKPLVAILTLLGVLILISVVFFGLRG